MGPRRNPSFWVLRVPSCHACGHVGPRARRGVGGAGAAGQRVCDLGGNRLSAALTASDLEDPDPLRRPVRRDRRADHPSFRHRSPEAAVVGLAAVVAHHEEAAVRHRDRALEGAALSVAARVRERVGLASAVAYDVPVLDLDAIAADADDALDERLVRALGRWCRARAAAAETLGRDAADRAGRVVGALRWVEDDDVADRRIAEAHADAVHEHALADVERRLHRAARDPIRLDEQQLDEEGDQQRRNDDRDDLDDRVALLLDAAGVGCLGHRWTVNGSARGRAPSGSHTMRATRRLPCLHCGKPMAHAPEKLLLAKPRGYCAGVDRAVQTVERALDLHGAPVYVRKEIVHNKHVVEQLRSRGAIFVDEETEVPEGSTVVFSAHGVAPSVHANARARGLQTIDATCPLVTKVHVEAKRFAAEGYTIVLVGHEGHEEVEGTMGEAPDHIVLIETEEDVDRLEVADPERVAYISQTTLSVDETRAIIARLRERFPAAVGPRTDDICYATTNRQAAVRQLARECDLVLVIGSQNSSNSNRLVEAARDLGADSYLIDNDAQVREEWLAGARTVGITSGASAPEELVERLVAYFRARGTEDVSELEAVQEDVRFMLPKEIRREVAGRA